MSYIPRLKKLYNKKIREELKKELKLDNIWAVVNLEKIVINVGLGDGKDDKNLIEDLTKDIALIAGQKPIATKAKKAISNFKIRAGQNIGIKVTLRGDRMWEFLDRLINIVLPRVKDFRGVSLKAFDGHGNYSLGLKEHTVFPEIDTNKVTKPHGLQINIITKNGSDEATKLLLTKLGMPFNF